MTSKQVLFQRIVSADGRSVAEAISSRSQTFANNGGKVTQSVTVKTTSGNSSSSSSSSSTSSSQ